MKEVKTIIDEEGNRFEIVVEKDESWFKRTTRSIGDGVKSVADFCKRHPLIALGALATIVDGTCKVTNSVAHARNAKVRSIECKSRTERHYDKSNRLWYDLNRPMTNSEKLEFSRRKADGESDGDILMDMNLI